MEFKYSAINKSGQTEKDVLDATSYHDAISQLHQRGLIPTEVIEKKQDLLTLLLTKFSGVKLQDKIVFIQNLSIMLRAGISLTKGLKILSQQSNSAKFKNVLEQVY